MSDEELEQELKRLEEQIKDLKVKLEEKVEKKPYEVEVPEDIRDYYYVDTDGLMESLFGCSDELKKEVYQRGLAFKTREEAEQFKKEQILLFKLHKWAEEHNGGWIPNWKDLNGEKTSVIYDNEYKKLKSVKNYRYQEIIKQPYFKSEEIAREFIEVFGEEIKEVLC